MIGPLPGGLTNYCSSLLWRCWLGWVTCQSVNQRQELNQLSQLPNLMCQSLSSAKDNLPTWVGCWMTLLHLEKNGYDLKPTTTLVTRTNRTHYWNCRCPCTKQTGSKLVFITGWRCNHQHVSTARLFSEKYRNIKLLTQNADNNNNNNNNIRIFIQS